MFPKLKNFPHKAQDSHYRAKLSRFQNVDTDVLISLYKDIEQSHKAIIKALDSASSTQTFYFSADAGNCAKTMVEIKNVLFSRGIRDFP
ncbi:MAG: hypothetical protein RBG13Loki_0731 [Promethearchaeota archaeon CR_4]|nr:MAG: hypothetical protein RBG13Loki_0731 [Candidatus Lokiarchaeota archaeon CR_4]